MFNKSKVYRLRKPRQLSVVDWAIGSIVPSGPYPDAQIINLSSDISDMLTSAVFQYRGPRLTYPVRLDPP